MLHNSPASVSLAIIVAEPVTVGLLQEPNTRQVNLVYDVLAHAGGRQSGQSAFVTRV